MSGLYLIGVIALWLWISSLLWKGLGRWSTASHARPAVLNGIVLLITLLWLGASFWYAGGRKFYYDSQVQEMCAFDGGIQVYETVRLPAEKFNRYGQLRIPSKRSADSRDEYYYETNMDSLITGEVDIWRLKFTVYRARDNKLLGIATSYGRRGGDMPGPWHKSSYSCPRNTDVSDLKNHIFITE